MSDETRAAGCSDGVVAPGFEAVRELFEQQLVADPEHSAQLAVRVRGELVIDLSGGPHLERTALTGVYSASKGVAALTVATLVDERLLDLDAPVARYWPEFAAAGKAAVTVRMLLSHQAGLVNTRERLSADEFYDSVGAAAALARTRPAWRPGSGFGYHGLTIGPLVEELVRRVTGETLQARYERVIRAPRDIDFHLGLPEREERRYVPLRGARLTAAEEEEERRQASPDPLALAALGLDDDPAAFSPNSRRARAHGSASIGGVGSARGLAAVYAAAIGQDAFLGVEAMEAMSEQQVSGTDLVLGGPMRFGVLFEKPHPRSHWGGHRAFGHDGAAGALGFADPELDLAFGYIPVPAPHPGGADVRAVRLSSLVRSRLRVLQAPRREHPVKGEARAV